jgi:hypothetical protein
LEKIIWDVHPGSRIFFPSRIPDPDPGVKKAPDPDPQLVLGLGSEPLLKVIFLMNSEMELRLLSCLARAW